MFLEINWSLTEVRRGSQLNKSLAGFFLTRSPDLNFLEHFL